MSKGEGQIDEGRNISLHRISEGDNDESGFTGAKATEEKQKKIERRDGHANSLRLT